jgi:hypothetical protein
MDIPSLSIVVCLVLFLPGVTVMRKVMWGETSQTIDRPQPFYRLMFRAWLFAGCMLVSVAITAPLLGALAPLLSRKPDMAMARLLALVFHCAVSWCMYVLIARSGRRESAGNLER